MSSSHPGPSAPWEHVQGCKGGAEEFGEAHMAYLAAEGSTTFLSQIAMSDKGPIYLG